MLSRSLFLALTCMQFSLGAAQDALDILQDGNPLKVTRDAQFTAYTTGGDATDLTLRLAPISMKVALLKRFAEKTVLRDIWEESFGAAKQHWFDGKGVEADEGPGFKELKGLTTVDEFFGLVESHMVTLKVPDTEDTVTKQGLKKAFKSKDTTDGALWTSFQAIFSGMYRNAQYFVAAKYAAKLPFAANLDLAKMNKEFGYKDAEAELDPKTDDGSGVGDVDASEDAYITKIQTYLTGDVGVEKEFNRIDKDMAVDALVILDAKDLRHKIRESSFVKHTAESSTQLEKLIAPIAMKVAVLKRFTENTAFRDMWEEAYKAADKKWRPDGKAPAAELAAADDFSAFHTLVKAHVDSLTEVPTTEDKLVGKAEGLVKVLASGSAFAPSADMYKALWEKMYRDANYFVAAESWPKSKEQNVDVGTMNRQFGFALNMANELNPNTDDGTDAADDADKFTTYLKKIEAEFSRIDTAKPASTADTSPDGHTAPSSTGPTGPTDPAKDEDDGNGSCCLIVVLVSVGVVLLFGGVMAFLFLCRASHDGGAEEEEEQESGSSLV